MTIIPLLAEVSCREERDYCSTAGCRHRSMAGRGRIKRLMGSLFNLSAGCDENIQMKRSESEGSEDTDEYC